MPAANRMTEQDYDRARAELGNRKDSAAKWDQQLATLFIRSAWTQEQLAAKEGCKPRIIAYRLCFGRFLNDCTNVQFPKNLTEGKFRDYWSRTEGGNDRQRFAEVQKLMAADLALLADRRPKLGPIIEGSVWRDRNGVIRIKGSPSPSQDDEEISPQSRQGKGRAEV
jgi:hypothetical protein